MANKWPKRWKNGEKLEKWPKVEKILIFGKSLWQNTKVEIYAVNVNLNV